MKSKKSKLNQFFLIVSAFAFLAMVGCSSSSSDSASSDATGTVKLKFQ